MELFPYGARLAGEVLNIVYPEDAYNFYAKQDMARPEESGQIRFDFAGKTFVAPNTVLSKAAKWFSADKQFERMGVFTAKDESGGVLIADFIPLASVVVDAATTAGREADPDARQSVLSFYRHFPRVTQLHF